MYRILQAECCFVSKVSILFDYFLYIGRYSFVFLKFSGYHILYYIILYLNEYEICQTGKVKRKSMPKHIVVKLQNKDKGKILEAAREKGLITYKGMTDN